VLERDHWLDLARKLDWTFSYVREEEVFPTEMAGHPWLSQEAWKDWEEPFRTSYGEYVATQHQKEASLDGIRSALGHASDFAALPDAWQSAVKFHMAILPLAEFSATVGNLGAARFARDSAWRTAATFGALDEMRHAQIPLRIAAALVGKEPQLDFAHRLYHTNHWVAIAGRHLFEELLLTSNPIEFAIGTHFVFETGLTNLQFIGLSSLAHGVRDRLFESMISSIQTDEARHAQIGPAVLEFIVREDPKYAQELVDKWLWRSFLLFSVLTGFSMDYLTPLHARRASFKEFMNEWVIAQFVPTLRTFGLEKPAYFDTFLEAIENYHHMAYLTAYTHRSTLWFDASLPSPDERKWLLEKYPSTFADLLPLWEQVDQRWRRSGPSLEWYAHAAVPPGFCELCQLPLCGGTPTRNSVCTREFEGKIQIFCSKPCQTIFERERGRYGAHVGLVRRILAGDAPANLLALIRTYFGVPPSSWGRDIARGDYDFLRTPEEPASGG
jgi:toluene monooxygenase system protein A